MTEMIVYWVTPISNLQTSLQKGGRQQSWGGSLIWKPQIWSFSRASMKCTWQSCREVGQGEEWTSVSCCLGSNCSSTDGQLKRWVPFLCLSFCVCKRGQWRHPTSPGLQWGWNEPMHIKPGTWSLCAVISALLWLLQPKWGLERQKELFTPQDPGMNFSEAFGRKFSLQTFQC
jgi:hypothetical protein